MVNQKNERGRETSPYVAWDSNPTYNQQLKHSKDNEGETHHAGSQFTQALAKCLYRKKNATQGGTYSCNRHKSRLFFTYRTAKILSSSSYDYWYARAYCRVLGMSHITPLRRRNKRKIVIHLYPVQGQHRLCSARCHIETNGPELVEKLS